MLHPVPDINLLEVVAVLRRVVRGRIARLDARGGRMDLEVADGDERLMLRPVRSRKRQLDLHALRDEPVVREVRGREERVPVIAQLLADRRDRNAVRVRERQPDAGDGRAAVEEGDPAELDRKRTAREVIHALQRKRRIPDLIVELYLHFFPLLLYTGSV